LKASDYLKKEQVFDIAEFEKNMKKPLNERINERLKAV